MNSLFPGIIVSFRESLEALLILILICRFLDKVEHRHLFKSVFLGFISSVIFSSFIGFGLFLLEKQFGKMDEVGKLWESGASLIAVGLVTSFIVWMIQHGYQIKEYVENKTSLNLNHWGIYVLSFVLIAREGVEIAVFSFAGQYSLLSLSIGMGVAVLFSSIFYFSMLNLKMSSIFKITLIYLILQAGYLLGYGIHEGLSALKTLGYLEANSPLLLKAFDVSSGILNHKEGWLGLPMNILFGWYSKPEILQLFSQYLLTSGLFLYFFKKWGK